MSTMDDDVRMGPLVGPPEPADDEADTFRKVWGEESEQTGSRRRSVAARKKEKVWGHDASTFDAGDAAAAAPGHRVVEPEPTHAQRQGQKLHFGLSAASLLLALITSGLVGLFGMIEFASVGARGSWSIPSLATLTQAEFDLVDRIFGVGIGISALGLAFAVLRKKN